TPWHAFEGAPSVPQSRFAIIEAAAGNLHQLRVPHQSFRRVLRVLESKLVQRGQAGPFLVGLVQRYQCARRTSVERIIAEDALITAKGAFRSPYVLLIDGGCPIAELNLAADGRHLVGRRAQHLGQSLEVTE